MSIDDDGVLVLKLALEVVEDGPSRIIPILIARSASEMSRLKCTGLAFMASVK
jgi:hypothetical protein